MMFADVCKHCKVPKFLPHLIGAAIVFCTTALPASESLDISVSSGDGGYTGVVKIFLLLTALSLAPAIIISMTCFTRIIVVLGFLRQAVGLQQIPPNQVIIGLGIFLTLFSMKPVWDQIDNQAVQPYRAGMITDQEALSTAIAPLKEFMLTHVKEKELILMNEAVGNTAPQSPDQVSLLALVPAFMLSELKSAFMIGVRLFIPFLVIDLVVAMLLTSLGMMMMPPVMISLPIKVIVFVLVDGWNLVVSSLLNGIIGA